MASAVWAGRPSKTVCRILVAAVLALLLLTWNQAYLSTAWTVGNARGDAAGSLYECPTNRQSQNNIGFIVKTGASEALDKLPAQLQTTLSCAESLLLVADLDFEVAGYQVHDVLKNVSQAVRDNDSAFDIYHRQRRLTDEGFTLEQLSKSPDDKAPSHNAGWELDKFKFLPMVYKAYADMPDKDWYVFMEADTYFNWNNLLSWLNSLDASETLYIGSPSFMGGNKFNHGGSGYVLSGPAIRAFASQYPSMASVWDDRAIKECCGDYVLTLALKEIGIEVSGVWPMLSGEPPLETPFGPALWCQPILTLHHVTANGLRDMWLLDHEFAKSQRRIHFQDLYQHWLPDGLPAERVNWDNRCPGSVFDIKNLPAESATSIDECSKACANLSYCMQYLFRKGECRLYKCFTLGKAAEPSEDTPWHSVWRLDRINAWIEQHSTCSTEWVQHSPANQRFGGVAGVA